MPSRRSRRRRRSPKSVKVTRAKKERVAAAMGFNSNSELVATLKKQLTSANDNLKMKINKAIRGSHGKNMTVESLKHNIENNWSDFR
jgi:hypothetical protein